MSSMQFDQLLLHISGQLSCDQLDELKFLYRDEIGKRVLERVRTGIHLFQILFERNALRPDDTELLALRLDSIRREDLAETLRDFHRPSAFDDQQREEEHGKSDLDVATDVVAENLGRMWRKLGRHLGLKDGKLDSIGMKHPTDLEETARELLKEWRRKSGPDCQVSELIKALRGCQLNMTADSVEDELAAAGFPLT